MRIIKWILGIVVVVVVAFAVIGMFLPRQVNVSRSVSVAAPPDAVFPYVNSLKATQEWAPWLERDPDVKLAYEGPEDGVGAKMSWTSDHPQVGNGKQEITESVENEKVITALDFGDMGTANASFVLDPSGASTTVTWDLDVDMGAGPIGRWMGLMMDKWVGADYEAGLANLKKLVEG